MVLNEELKMAYELVASLKDENIKLHAEKMNHETDKAIAVEAERKRIVAMVENKKATAPITSLGSARNKVCDEIIQELTGGK